MFEPAERLKNVKVSASAAMTRKVRELRAQGVKIVGLSSGEPDFKSPLNAIEAANKAALAAVGMGVASRTLLERAKGNPQFFGALSSIRFIPQTGAVVIKDKNGTIIGAAGASGGTGDEDEAVCIAGIEAAGLAWG
ncbi:MAG TPA: heme-binding protein [Reyranella sp.]